MFAIDFLLGHVELEMFRASAAFQTHPCLRFIRDEAIEQRSQKRSKGPLLRVVRREHALLERMRQKALRQILGILNASPARDAKVFVERLPVERDENVERARALRSVGAPKRENDAPPRGGEGHGLSIVRRVGNRPPCDSPE